MPAEVLYSALGFAACCFHSECICCHCIGEKQCKKKNEMWAVRLSFKFFFLVNKCEDFLLLNKKILL